MRMDPGEPYYRINSDEAKAILDSGEDVAVVDVRNLDEYHVRTRPQRDPYPRG